MEACPREKNQWQEVPRVGQSSPGGSDQAGEEWSACRGERREVRGERGRSRGNIQDAQERVNMQFSPGAN